MTYRQEKNFQAYYNPDNPYASTLTSAVDPGIDGVVGTADDSTYGFYARTSAANRVIITNDTNYLQTYKGLELTVNKRLSDRWQMVAGYTLAKTEINNITLAQTATNPSPNLLINATHAMPEGGTITLTIATEDRPGAHHMWIDISDTGTGVAESIRETVPLFFSIAKS